MDQGSRFWPACRPARAMRPADCSSGSGAGAPGAVADVVADVVVGAVTILRRAWRVGGGGPPPTRVGSETERYAPWATAVIAAAASSGVVSPANRSAVWSLIAAPTSAVK